MVDDGRASAEAARGPVYASRSSADESIRGATDPGADAGWLSRERALAFTLVAATLLAFYLCFRVVSPFLPALAWALALAIVTHPLHCWIARRIVRPALAAGATVVIVVVALVAPAVFVTQQVARQVAVGIRAIQSEIETGRWRAAIERNPRAAPVLTWLEGQLDISDLTSRATDVVSTYGGSFVAGSVWTAMQFLIMLFTLFYFFRDRPYVTAALRSVMPLSHGETDEIFGRVADTIYATVYGSFTVALVQGSLGGLMFWILGLPAPLLWGAVMALLALVPMLGTFVVWGPAAVFLAIEGNWIKALILVGWGAAAIGLIDNLLYPVLVGHRLRMHPLPVFFAVVGGVITFGATGLILGPVILAVTVGLIQIWRHRTAAGKTADAEASLGSSRPPHGSSLTDPVPVSAATGGGSPRAQTGASGPDGLRNA